MLLDSEVLGCRESHIRDKKTLHSRILRRIDKRDDTIQCTSVGESIAEEIIVIISHTHTAEDNLVSLGTHRHHSHNLVERLVRISKKRNLLTRHESIVKVDTSDTRSDELRRLLATHRVDRRTSDLHLLTLNLRSPIDRLSISIEETSCKLIADLERRSLAKESNLGIGRNATSTLKDLESDIVTHNLYHLSQTAIDSSKFVISHTPCLERTSSLGDLTYLCVYFLKCCSHCH